MTDYDVDVDPRVEALLRETLATIAATSHIVDETDVPSPAGRRWPKVAAVLLIVAGLAAIALAVRPAEEAGLAGAGPGWYEWVSPQLPDGFVHVAVLQSDEDYVIFEAIDLESSMLLNLAVSRRPTATDPSGAITSAELDSHPIDIDGGLNVSLPDGRQIGVHCAVLAFPVASRCSALERPVTAEELRALAHRLAELRPDLLPDVDSAAPIVDRSSLAASAAFDVTGLAATAGVERGGFMHVQIGGEPGFGLLLIRSVTQYFPPIGPADATTRSTTVDDFLLTWSAMPDGSVWIISGRQSVGASIPRQILEHIATRLSDGTVPTFPTTDATNPPTSRWPLDELDPLDAPRRVSIAAVIAPTPDEAADLAIAGALLENDCLRDGGAAPPLLTPLDHQLARQAAVAELLSATDFLTSGGLDFVRANGYDARRTADPTHLDIAEGSLEEGLLIAGCGGADDDLRPGLAEQQLVRLTELGAEWGYQRVRPDRAPTYATRYALYQDCMSAAGLSTIDPDNAETNPIAQFLGNQTPSPDELAYVSVDVDCRNEAELPKAYVEAVSPLVDEFITEQADALAAVRAERDVALAVARAVLTDHGIEPFTRAESSQ